MDGQADRAKASLPEIVTCGRKKENKGRKEKGKRNVDRRIAAVHLLICI